MSKTENKQHKCKAMISSDNISIQKINGKWYWVFWDDKKGNKAHGIGFCPYCGKNLTETRAGE